MERFIDKVAVVTGSSSGIGKAISEELVKHGVIVVGLARRLEKLQELSDKLAKSNNSGKFYPLKCDVTKETEIHSSFEWIINEIGSIHILVNNAGVSNIGFMRDLTDEQISRVFDTNVKGVLLCSKKAVNHMNDHSIDGHIININSVSGHSMLKSSRMALYSSSKHALTVISEGMRLENTNIKVSNINPGLTYSEMTEQTQIKFGDEINQSKYFLEAKNVAETCISVLNTPPYVLISDLTIRPIRSLLKLHYDFPTNYKANK